MFTYKNTKDISLDKILNLYNDVGWLAYTKKPEVLEQAIQNSLMIISAWEKDELIGLIRVVGDGLTIIYIQDILVLNNYQRKGIGKTLILKILDEYPHVRQKALMTDDTPKTRKFYEAMGFTACDNGQLIAFMKNG